MQVQWSSSTSRRFTNEELGCLCGRPCKRAGRCFGELCLIDEALEENDNIVVRGFENQLVNEVALSANWSVESSWTFKKDAHINLLEEAALLKLVSFLGSKMKPIRVVVLVDSFVCKGATSKGRSSSRSLSSILRKVNARLVAFGIYLCVVFVPTRWNTADDPTRDVQLRSPIRGFQLDPDDIDSLRFLASIPPTRRWASNWIRLVLLMSSRPFVDFTDRSTFRAPRASFPSSVAHSSMDFDATLGFPGEGPAPTNLLLGFLLRRNALSWICSWDCWVLLAAAGCFCS